MDKETGALGAVSSLLPTGDSPGGIGALAQVAYGGAAPPMAGAGELLEKVLPLDRLAQDEDTAFWGGITDPKVNPGQHIGIGVGEGIRAQSARQLEHHKLRAAYMPLIMQSIVQGQAMTIAAANAQRDFMKEVNPKFQSWMSGLRYNDRVPSREEAEEHLHKFADMYQLPPGMRTRLAQQLPGDPAEMKKYLDALILASKPDAALPTHAQDAAGRGQAVSPVMGTARTLGPQGAGAEGTRPGEPGGGMGGNPAKAEVQFTEKAMGDPEKYTSSLIEETTGWKKLTERLNVQAELGQAFQQGRYANNASGVASAIQDAVTRLGLNKEAVAPIIQKILGSPAGSPEAVGAQQAFEALANQDTLAMTKALIGAGQRLTNMELSAIQQLQNGARLTPEAFNIMREMGMRRYAESVNKQQAWNEYLQDPNIRFKSVPHFDSMSSLKAARPQLEGKDIIPPGKVSPAEVPANVLPTQGTNTGSLGQGGGQAPAKTTQNVAPASPAKPAGGAAPAKPQQVDLSQYEPGAIVGPTGKVLVKDPKAPMGYRLARQKGG